jgi:hypothetical protein
LKNKHENRRKASQRQKCLKKRATEINYKMHEIKPSYCSENCSSTWRHGYGFIERNYGWIPSKKTSLPFSRVLLKLETTKLSKSASSAPKIRRRVAFCHGKAP